MTGTWPNLDAADLEARVRTYLNEVAADFYSQAEIWRWLSVGVKDIAQKTSCIRRVLDSRTIASTRTVATRVYKVHHVEYLPATGRAKILEQITPLQVGQLISSNDTVPACWYEFGSTIGIDPLPTAIYELRLYVADIPKMVWATITSFAAGWTAGTGWSAGSNAAHSGASSGDLTYTTSTLAASTNHTLMFTVTGIGTGGSVTPYIGATPGVPVTTNGYHTQNILSPAGTPSLKFTAVNSVTIDDLYIYKEADYAAVTDQTELPSAWQHHLALYATWNGLDKDKKYGAARMLESLYGGELAYLRHNIIEIIPNGGNELKKGG